MIKRLGTYTATILFTLYSVFFIVPNLHFNLEGLNAETKTLKEIDTKDYKYTSKKWTNQGSGNNRRLETRENTATTLIYTMTDNSKVRITGHNPKYNGALLNRENFGKEVKIYTEKGGLIPIQIEIDNKVIFGLKETNQFKYIILAFALVLIIYSILLWTRVTK